MTIRACTVADAPEICAIVNDSAQAYKGIIPADRWHEPYMPLEHLQQEMADGVRFWGCDRDGELAGVMGLQDRDDVDLIRHAYVRTQRRQQGIGEALLKHVEATTSKPILVGTWATAAWAIRFYQKNGYRLLSHEDAASLLKKYWNIPARQVETSVVLANSRWKPRGDRMDEKSLFIGFWTNEAKTTRNVLARIPEGSDYRPDPKSRTAQEIAWQIVCEEKMIIDALESGKAEWAPPPLPKTMKEVLEAYEKQSARMDQRWKALPAARWDGMLEFFGSQRPASPMAWSFLFDIVHHRGQITTYLRPMGSTVPQIYGPSADEP